jgi:hypothetical protein
MLLTTVAKCFAYAGRSDLAGLAPVDGLPRRESHARYRRMIAWLHFIQPIARLRGLVRGLMNPPSDVPAETSPSAERSLVRSAGAALGALRLLAGESVVARYWGETWTAVDSVLHGVVRELRATRAVSSIAVDDGWQHDRDVSVGLGPWARLDLRALVEEHAQGRVLLRVGTRLRLTGVGASALALLSLALFAASVYDASEWPVVALFGATLAATVLAFFFVRLWSATAALRHAVERTAGIASLIEIERPARRIEWARRAVLALRGGLAAVVLLAAGASLGSVVQAALAPLARPARPAAAPAPRTQPVQVAAPPAVAPRRPTAASRPVRPPSAVRTSASAARPQPIAAVMVIEPGR